MSTATPAAAQAVPTKNHHRAGRSVYEAGQTICLDGTAYYHIADVNWIGTYPHDYPRLVLSDIDKPETVVRKVTPSSHGGSIRIVEDLAEKTPDDYEYKKGDLLLHLGCVWRVTNVELRRPGVIGAEDGSKDYQSVEIVNLTSAQNPWSNKADKFDASRVRPRLTDESSIPTKSTIKVLPRRNGNRTPRS